MRSRILFVARRPPFPQTGGAPIRTHRLLTGLADEFAVTFVTFEHHPRSGEVTLDRRELASLLPGIEVVTVPGLRIPKRLGQAFSLASPWSWEWRRYRKPALVRTLRSLARERGARLAHFDDVGVAHAAPLPRAANVFAPHNVEHRLARAAADASGGVRRAFGQLEWRKVAREERELWRTMDLTLALSETEAAAMRAAGAARVALCPNGVDQVPLLPLSTRQPKEPLRVLFVGTGSYQPNERGLAWFIRDVLPRVRGRTPLELDIVGEPPNRPVRAEGVSYRGRVDDLEPWYARAHAVAVPLFEGSGTRLKVIEAAAYGRPMVSTALGAEGLPLEPGTHFFHAEEAEAFAEEIARIAEMAAGDGVELRDMVAAARARVEPLFWPRITEKLVATYTDEIARLEASGHHLAPP